MERRASTAREHHGTDVPRKLDFPRGTTYAKKSAIAHMLSSQEQKNHRLPTALALLFAVTVFLVLTRMHRNGARGYKYGYEYGVAFPASFRKMVLRKIPFDVMDKLNLYLFFVDTLGKVEELDWKKIKEMK